MNFVLEKSAQVHVAHSVLTERESEIFDVVFVAAPSGREALRRLVRRWDPLSGGKAQSAPATNLGSRSVQTTRPYHRTREVGGTGAPIRMRRIERNDDNSFS